VFVLWGRLEKAHWFGRIFLGRILGRNSYTQTPRHPDTDRQEG
jgi:hypothetical protein